MGLSPGRAQLAATIGESILFGTNIILEPVTLWLLLARRKRSTSTIALICFMVIMFAISTAHYVIITNYTFLDFLDTNVADLPNIYTTSNIRSPSVWLPNSLDVINEVLGDTIVIWRAWILWDCDIRIVAPPLLCWIATIVSGVGSVCSVSRKSNYPTPEFSTSADTGIWIVTFLASTFLTNLCTVGIISYRYWDVVSILGRHALTQKRFFLVVIESGSLYCATLIILAAVYVTGSQAISIMTQLISQLTTVYPTLIIILVCLKITQKDDIDKLYSLSLGDSSESARSPVDSEKMYIEDTITPRG